MRITLGHLYTMLLVLSAMIVPMYFTHFRFEAGGLILRLADIMSFLIISLFIICYRKGVINLFSPRGFFVLLFFLIYFFVNNMFQAGLVKALVATFQWVLILTTLLIAYSCSVMNRQLFIDVFIKMLLLICFITVMYHFSIGKFVHYKHLGDTKFVLALTGVIVASYTYVFKSKKYLLALIIFYPFILFSLERKGILAFHLVSFIYLFFSSKNIARFGLCAGFFALMVVVFFYPQLLDPSNYSFFEYSDIEMLHLDEAKAAYTSNLHRQSLVMNGFDIFKNNPIFGVGAKMLPEYMAEYYFNPGLGVYAHNVFLDSLIEQGSVGAVLLFMPYVMFLILVKFPTRAQLVCFCALSVYSLIMLMFMSGGAPSKFLMFLPLIMSNVFYSKIETNDNKEVFL